MLHVLTKKSLACIVGSFTAGLMLVAGASAADYSNYAPLAYQDAPAYKWQGAYIGAHGGLASPKANPFASGKGFVGGGQVGYNFQFGPAVLGAELEGTYMGNAKVKTATGRIEERLRGAGKARAGLSFDQTLVYGTAGVTMTKFANGDMTKVASGYKQGYLVGGGFERAFAGGLSTKIEYNYVMTDGVKTSTATSNDKSNIRDHVIKAGLNYRF